MTESWMEGARADEPMDEADQEILRSLGAAVVLVDPVPDGLVDRILFAMTLERLDADVAEMMEQVSTEPVSIRGDAAAVAETITFTSSELSVMITLSEVAGGVRIDGWVAPGGAFRIEVHRSAGVDVTETDPDGRFVFTAVPRGQASLLIHCEEPHRRSLRTPTFEL
ncbi:hypothetical protein SAMN05216410_1533 [Sanguibacter gelidistatuariae]|uniref:Carboxypeptidase regulatory-like domain-containing protein n=1 Tax=Sanguibacter gelidistatuariae TaxID=1814289 RepID=A0A1G6K9I2_9MICO|nr:hypothetical protein [Sanguibacter gelidistatuariae]SDC27491.1 hypothetical protein SAMN05216410_1533 [Sanguibacter gelidistatuariae]